MKRKRVNGMKVLLAFSVAGILVMGALFIAMCVVSHLTEKNTTELSATVERDAYFGQMGLIIPTEEFQPNLILLVVTEDEFSREELSNLQSGQKIFFRIQDRNVNSLSAKKPEALEEDLFVAPIVSVSTETQEIFSLSDYNKSMQRSVLPGMLVTGSLVLLGLIGTLYSIVKLWRQRQ